MWDLAGFSWKCYKILSNLPSLLSFKHLLHYRFHHQTDFSSNCSLYSVDSKCFQPANLHPSALVQPSVLFWLILKFEHIQVPLTPSLTKISLTFPAFPITFSFPLLPPKVGMQNALFTNYSSSFCLSVAFWFLSSLASTSSAHKSLQKSFLGPKSGGFLYLQSQHIWANSWTFFYCWSQQLGFFLFLFVLR